LRSAWGSGALVFDIVDVSVLPLLEGVEVLVSALDDGVVEAAPAAVVLSALPGVDVWAIDTPPARAAAAARMVKVFLVAFMLKLLGGRARQALGGWEGTRRRVPAASYLRTAP
jgi:hypothetical protein